MRVFIDIEYNPSKAVALTTVQLGPNRMRNDFTTTRIEEGLAIRIKPQIHENEEALVALIQALDTSDELTIGLGQLIEAAFLTGIEIGKESS
jgi:hypothetical protein